MTEHCTEKNCGECLVLNVNAEKTRIKEKGEVNEITWQIRSGDRD